MHRFEYRRADGTGEAIEMETRSLLLHDLTHYAVESEARLKGSFYGILAKIGGYQELSVNGGAALGGEVAITERIVGALQGALARDDFDEATFRQRSPTTSASSTIPSRAGSRRPSSPRCASGCANWTVAGKRRRSARRWRWSSDPTRLNTAASLA